jgi:hypothetical protein
MSINSNDENLSIYDESLSFNTKQIEIVTENGVKKPFIVVKSLFQSPLNLQDKIVAYHLRNPSVALFKYDENDETRLENRACKFVVKIKEHIITTKRRPDRLKYILDEDLVKKPKALYKQYFEGEADDEKALEPTEDDLITKKDVLVRVKDDGTVTKIQEYTFKENAPVYQVINKYIVPKVYASNRAYNDNYKSNLTPLF